VTTMLKDVNTERMEEIESDLLVAVGQIFPADRFDTQVTVRHLGI
jgi:hypothetical protein